MATAAAIALGLTSAVGLYGATAQEKRVQSQYGTDTSGIQARMDNETARADAANARALKLQQDLDQERKRRQESEGRCCNSPAAEDAFRRANPQVLALAAEGVIGELNIVDPKLQEILKRPSTTVFRRGTILQLYELAVLAESSTQQRGGGDGDPQNETPAIAPPPTPASAADFAPKETIAEAPPGGWGATALPATSIAEMGCLAFAALWLKHINLALGGVTARKEEKQAQEAQIRSDAEAVGRAQALHESLLKAVNAANASRASIDQMFDNLPADRKEFVQMARDAFENALSKANELVVATESGKIPTIATWMSDIESNYPDWKTTKDSLQRTLAEYETATKGAATTKEQLPLSVRLFGPKVPPRAPVAPLFTGTSIAPGPTSQVVPEPIVTPETEPVVTPETEPVVTPETEPVITSEPVVTPETEPVVTPETVITSEPVVTPETVVTSEPVVTPAMSNIPVSIGGPFPSQPRTPPRPPTAAETRRANVRRLLSLSPEQRAQIMRNLATRKRIRLGLPASNARVVVDTPIPIPASAPFPDAVTAFREAAATKVPSVTALDTKLEEEIGSVLTPEEIAATDTSTAQALATAEEANKISGIVNQPLGPDVDVEAEMAALSGPTTAAVSSPISANPPLPSPAAAGAPQPIVIQPPPAPATPDSELQKKLNVVQMATKRDELERAIADFQNTLSMYPGNVKQIRHYLEEITKAQRRLAAMQVPTRTPTKRWRRGGLRKRTLKKRRGVNKRNV